MKRFTSSLSRLLLIGSCILTIVLSFAEAADEPSGAKAMEGKPNIVWIIPDDMSAHFACYGETAIETPHLDALAEKGALFTNAYVTAPVCSTCRSALITGMYQTTIGSHHHRSGRGELKIHLSEPVQLVPKLFQDAGYHTSISSWPGTKGKFGKTDYNFEWDQAVYDSSLWQDREEGQPFFHQVHTPGGKLRGKDEEGWEKVQKRAEELFGDRTSESAVTLPPYYPDHPDIVRDWAAYLDSVRVTDHMIGEVIAQLEEEGLLENTLVIFMTDHGISHARGKQFLYDEGIHVPLVIAGPGVTPGTVREDVVEHIDLAALSLAAAGIEVPDWMQAQDILADDYAPREAVFSARDRCDETVDHLRSVRTQDFKYIRNFLPQRPYLQPSGYKDAKDILKALRESHEAGVLTPTQQLLMRETRPEEELYDVVSDPFEITNLADDPAYADELAAMRERLETWMEETGDQGREPEDPDRYLSEMADYVGGGNAKRKDPAHLQRIEDNIKLMKLWAEQGK
ncbi:MAG: sulfatase [Verrucomicrobiota bacterium]